MRAIILIFGFLLAGCTGAPEGTTWTFGRLDQIGGVAAHAEGKPTIIATGAGPAVRFDGIADGLFVDSHPLAGAGTFTVEAVFRPEGGPFEQRWLHLAEVDPSTGADTGNRFLFEIRVVGDHWYLDAFARGPGYNRTLIAPEKLFPVGPWYRVAMTYDGSMFRSYVDGALQAEGPIAFRPQGPGRASVGVRINRVNWFKGAVLTARFTPRALPPEDFLSLPDGLNTSAK